MYHTHKNDRPPKTKLKVTEYCGLTDRELKITIMKKLSELLKDSKRRLMKSVIKLMNLQIPHNELFVHLTLL